MSEAVISGSKGSPSWVWVLTLGVASCLAIIFVIGFALPYLLLDAGVLARFEGRQGWVFTHVLSGAVALMVGPVQLWLGARRQRLALHRKLGILYLATVLLGSLSAFYLAATTQVSWVFGLGLGALGLAWVLTTGIAYVAILRRMILQHQEWMIRSYVVTFAFVMFRLFFGVMEAAEVGTVVERLNAASWFCWAVPLLIAEAIIQGRKVFGSKAAAGVG